mmetsp:Transcript_46319/g.93507  ORF Transcript_46319/g.93507 Transcript_46319/m.93507 type:complete len:144 (+) Transcript_46319:242-673(+)|eukprot:CAMPEP_0171600962 /NCGR_PEP_ID=MMETSP0990-20121206/4635_1 /TAXON_ID=483369 /ORGANISM="non described non described, Strain CCMP2098" /LENGTH=143 /DNA_ID=CAMNT_0012163019 /DNA_START=236 /DNA_END=667 /DNA_ORIENTATION=-
MGKGYGKGGDDEMWYFSLALFPIGLLMIICGATIQPYQGMTPEIEMFLYILGSLFMVLSISINATLRCFFLLDIDEMKVDVKRTVKERKRIKRRKEKRKNTKSALAITIPGFEDVKIRPALEDISDSDADDSDEGDVDPEAKW